MNRKQNIKSFNILENITFLCFHNILHFMFQERQHFIFQNIQQENESSCKIINTLIFKSQEILLQNL